MRETFKKSRQKWLSYVKDKHNDFSEEEDIMWEYEADKDSYFIFYMDWSTDDAKLVQLWNENGKNYFNIYKQETEG
jgi:hypothetical protein